MKLLNPNDSYTFSRYAEMPHDPEDLLAEFDCTLRTDDLELLPFTQPLPFLTDLDQTLRRSLRLVDLTSEMARRETLIAPILLTICHFANTRLKIEYPISVSNLLGGSLGYYIPSLNNLLVIEAKQADLSRGFVQLAVELIALDQWLESGTPVLYGAVTTGDAWKLGYFDRQQRQMTRDLNLYSVPANLEVLVRLLVGVLQPVQGI
ncbi:MAG: hypothetical protein AAGF66_20810 [Cyanobacteria bacterium P01_H01_bin.119]